MNEMAQDAELSMIEERADLRRSNRKTTAVRSFSPTISVSSKRIKKLKSSSKSRKDRSPVWPVTINTKFKNRKEIEEDEQLKLNHAGEGRSFGKKMAELLGDPDAERLWCPNYSRRECNCIQTHISESDDDGRQKAVALLEMYREACRLRTLKCYDSADICANGKKKKTVGLGNGHKKSKEFEEFVLKNRSHLRKNLKLCEKATQKILLYSNNFLHKKLKTEQKMYRVERVKGKAALGKLYPIDFLSKMSCCKDKCVQMAVTHPKLLEEWRRRAGTGQAEARRVLAEMLTPAAGKKTNCQSFIALVTGCCRKTISAVNILVHLSGGVREPPIHGLSNQRQRRELCQVGGASTTDLITEEPKTTKFKRRSKKTCNGKNLKRSNPVQRYRVNGDTVVEEESDPRQTDPVTSSETILTSSLQSSNRADLLSNSDQQSKTLPSCFDPVEMLTRTNFPNKNDSPLLATDVGSNLFVIENNGAFQFKCPIVFVRPSRAFLSGARPVSTVQSLRPVLGTSCAFLSGARPVSTVQSLRPVLGNVSTSLSTVHFNRAQLPFTLRGTSDSRIPSNRSLVTIRLPASINTRFNYSAANVRPLLCRDVVQTLPPSLFQGVNTVSAMSNQML